MTRDLTRSLSSRPGTFGFSPLLISCTAPGWLTPENSFLLSLYYLCNVSGDLHKFYKTIFVILSSNKALRGNNEPCLFLVCAPGGSTPTTRYSSVHDQGNKSISLSSILYTCSVYGYLADNRKLAPRRAAPSSTPSFASPFTPVL